MRALFTAATPRIYTRAAAGLIRTLNLIYKVLSIFIIRFNDRHATVELWIADEWFSNGTWTGSYSHVYLGYEGRRFVPDVTDYDFWRNSRLDWEDEKDTLPSDIEFRADSQQMLLFVNKSSEECYGAGNQTHFINAGPSMITEAHSSLGWALALLGTIPMPL